MGHQGQKRHPEVSSGVDVFLKVR